MIERQFIKQKVKELQIQEYLSESLKRVGHSKTKIKKSPLGDKVVISASRPGLIIGRQGSNIKLLTKTLKNKFKLDNPQIEIDEVKNPRLDAQIVAEDISNSLESFGSQRFKGIGHKVMTEVMASGAAGVEILISGKIPSSRAKTWRFYVGYLKKCGDIAINYVNQAYATAHLKTGSVGIIVKIMPSDIVLPSDVKLLDIEEESSEDNKEEMTVVEEEISEEEFKKKAEEAKAEMKKKTSENKEVETEESTEEPKEATKEEKASDTEAEEKPKKKAAKKKSTKKATKKEEAGEEK